MEGENTVHGNAARLERIGGLARYAELLRETAVSASPARYSFKLEFPDGRWALAEQELPTEPRVGDLVWFDGSPWQILGHRLVPRCASAGQPHDFLACTPA